jgi:hypothetical protein
VLAPHAPVPSLPASRSAGLPGSDNVQLLGIAPACPLGGRVLLPYIHDHDGYVVRAAGVEGRLNEGLDCLFGVLGIRGEEVEHAVLGDHVREAVGAEKQSVSGPDREDGRVDLDLFFGAQSAGD